MSQYSEIMGSFIRTGNYPLEANYIFPTEAALKEFYSNPINNTTLHKGLLKIVEDGGDGNLALYWVVKKKTNDELEFVKLIENIDISDIDTLLKELLGKLNEEIQNRKDSEEAIWGTSDPTLVRDDLNSILELSLEIIKLININDSFKQLILAIVGTLESNIIEYLKTLPYTSLTEISTTLNKFLTEVDSSSSEINTFAELLTFLEGYSDSLKLKEELTFLLNQILGNPIPSEEFRTLRAIEDFVRILKSSSENSDYNLLTELDRVLIGVGLSGDGSYNPDRETYYLLTSTSIMNALRILDSILFETIEELANKVELVDGLIPYEYLPKPKIPWEEVR